MELIIIGILILLNGFFALSEIALISSRRSRLEQYRKEGRKGAGTAFQLLENSENFLSAIQVGITLIGIINGVYGGLTVAEDIAPFFLQFPLLSDYANEIALAVTVIIITYFSILIGELVPKTFALSNPEYIAVRISRPVYWFSVLFYPFVKFLSWSTSVINRLLGIKKGSQHLTDTELRQILKTASREGVIERDQNLIHDRVFYFSEKKAKHIMVHRMEVDWVDLNEPHDLIKESIIQSRHSRLVCSKGDLDNFVGILNVKDFFAADTLSPEFRIESLLTQPIIVPDNADAHKVLNLVKQKQIHFCIVVNEYGSFEGIITLHDILENLIGDIPEEGDIQEPDIFVRDDKSYLISGEAPVEILDGIFDNYLTDFENIDYSTVAGFVLKKIGKIPEIGDKFNYQGHIIEIVDIDGKRIDKILLTKKE